MLKRASPRPRPPPACQAEMPSTLLPPPLPVDVLRPAQKPLTNRHRLVGCLASFLCYLKIVGNIKNASSPLVPLAPTNLDEGQASMMMPPPCREYIIFFGQGTKYSGCDVTFPVGGQQQQDVGS